MFGRKIKVLLLVSPLLIIGCALLDDNAPKKSAVSGLIATPPSYYSTSKARYLGGKYKENLDRMVERIVRNPKTSALQFANNNSSVGGIGFFTHSAAKTPDERYLEVVLATPETFETKGEVSDKVHRLFSRYGFEILGILSGDSDIYQDRELTGYGLNLAWRNILAEPGGNRVTMARAIIYFPKDRVRNFVRQELNQNDLLGNAVIFSVEEDGPLTLVSYQPQETRPDFRPAIREDNLTSAPAAPKPTSAQLSPAPGKSPNPKVEPKLEVTKKEPPAAKAGPSSIIVKPSLSEAKLEPKQGVTAAQKNSTVTAPNVNVGGAEEEPKPKPGNAADEVTITRGTETTIPAAPTNDSKPELNAPAPKLAPSRAQEVTPPASVAKAELQKTIPAISLTPEPALKAENDARKKTEETRQEVSMPPVQKPVVEVKKNEPEVKRAVEVAKRAPAVTAANTATEAKKQQTVPNEKQPEAAVAKLPIEKPSVTQHKEVKKNDESPAIVAKAEPSAPLTVPTRLTEKAPGAKAPEPNKTETPAVKFTELPRAVESKTGSSAASIAKAEAQSQEMKAPIPVAKAVPKEEIPNVKPREPTPGQTGNVVIENRTSDVKTAEKVMTTAPVAKAPVQSPAVEKVKPAQATWVAKAETPTPSPAPRIESTPAPVKPPEVHSPAVATAIAAAEKLTTDPIRPREASKPDSGPRVAKLEVPVIEAKSLPSVVAAPRRETSAEKRGGEQVALLKKPAEIVPEKIPIARPAPKALEGFIIQLGFRDKEKAQRWAEAMERRGYAISVTEAGAEGALRVRLGNFALRDDAERQLRTFKQEGLSGIIINLPQGFRPEARSSIP
jgi:DedD protein